MDKKVLSKRVGARITQLRKERGMTQADLGAGVSKDKEAITRIEKGNVTITIYTAALIAQALGISLSELFDFEEE